MNERIEPGRLPMPDASAGAEALEIGLLHAIIEVAEDAAIVIDAQRRIVLFNQGAATMFGYRADQVLGREVEMLIPSDVRVQHAGHVRDFGASSRASGRMGERGEIAGRRASGEVFPAEASISQVTVGGEKYFAAIVRDVSARKRAEAAVRESEARFRMLADSAPVGIFEAAESGDYLWVNTCWQQVAGMRSEEALGDGWARAIHPQDRARVYRDWRASVNASGPFQAEYRCLRPDGSEAWVVASAVPARPGYVGTLTDVTERRQQAAEMEAARHEAEAAAKAKSLFLANMSHEIRTPLNAVIGMTSLLLDTPISEEQRDFAHTIRSSGEALLAIINDILDFSKADLGKLELEQQVFELRRVIEDSLDLNAAPAAEKKLNLAYVIEEGTPDSLVGDATRLRQILVNLVNNAVKFTHHGEVTVTVDARPLENGRFLVHFAVRDTGIGIAPDRLAQLFQSFSQLDPSTTRKYGGTGLGLAISKRLAELMHGDAWAESEPGVGSVFHINIVSEPGPLPDHHYLRNSQPALAGKRVLIVDDNTTNRRILVKQALMWGMRPSATPSAIEALDLLRHGHAFDIAILDMGMPEMSGIDLAWEIRKQLDRDALPIVILTSMGARLDLPTDTELGLSAFVGKPLKPAQLYAVLTEALGGAPSVTPSASIRPVTARLAEQLPLKILVAEDNAVNQKVLLRLLERMGYRADVAANGFEVLDALERQRYDVILMDVHMPEMDGVQATHRIFQRHDRHEAPRVIGMTASVLPGERERCLAAGMDGFVTKPIDNGELTSALIGIPKPRREVRSEAHDDMGEVDRDGDRDASRNGDRDGDRNGDRARRTAGAEPGAEWPAGALATPAFEPRRGSSIDPQRLYYLVSLERDTGDGLLRELIDMFLREAPEHLERLRQACVEHDLTTLRGLAHRFKSSADNLGARRLASLCDMLEALESAEGLRSAESVLAEMAREFERAGTVLRGERDRL